jgi:2-methylcitrate dehydratase
VAAGAALLLGMTLEQAGHAAALALVGALPLRVTRAGQISGWKACATGHAARNAIFACRAARAGLTGPGEPFSGPHGLFEAGMPAFGFDLAGDTAPHAIEHGSLKRWPACYWSQTAIDAAIDLRERLRPAKVQGIRVDTWPAAWRSIGGGSGDHAHKWRPANRETADHSLPYLVASALLDGRVDDASFAPGRLDDPEVLAVLDRTSVEVDESFAVLAADGGQPVRITVTTALETVRAERSSPRSAPGAPLRDAEVEAKFDRQVSRVLSPADTARLQDLLWDLPAAASLSQSPACCGASRPE